jgi:DNA-binding LacI/PurR family transcriptional regulator
VPDDVRVIGFDDVEECRYSSPRLSSVRPDMQALAETALDLVGASGRGGVPPEDLEHRISHEVVVRESTLAS